MDCNLATVQASACSSGIGKETDPIALLRVIAQNYAETAFAASPINTVNVNDILARGCVSGIGKLTDENSLWRIIAQNLCSQINPSVPVVCATLTISGAGIAAVNQSYTKSGTDYTGNTDPTIRVIYNSSQGIYYINSSVSGDIYFQYGDFPVNWLPVGVGVGFPSGACA